MLASSSKANLPECVDLIDLATPPYVRLLSQVGCLCPRIPGAGGRLELRIQVYVAVSTSERVWPGRAGVAELRVASIVAVHPNLAIVPSADLVAALPATNGWRLSSYDRS